VVLTCLKEITQFDILRFNIWKSETFPSYYVCPVHVTPNAQNEHILFWLTSLPFMTLDFTGTRGLHIRL
jgi:hypothetical protein